MLQTHVTELLHRCYRDGTQTSCHQADISTRRFTVQYDKTIMCLQHPENTLVLWKHPCMQVHVDIILLACTAVPVCHADLDVHQQPAHKEAEGATPIVDAILYLVGGMERDDIGVVIQEYTPARTMPCECECSQTARTSVTAITCLRIVKAAQANAMKLTQEQTEGISSGLTKTTVQRTQCATTDYESKHAAHCNARDLEA